MLPSIENYWSFIKQGKTCFLCARKSQTQVPICNDCQADLPWLSSVCKRCALPLYLRRGEQLLCPQCLRHPPPYQRISAAFHYRFPINQLIMRSKFNRQPAFLALLAKLLIQKLDLTAPPQLLLPVPIHPSRLRQREYNQAFLIAKTLAKELHIRLDGELLRKTRNTEQQAGLDAQARKRNLRNSFCCVSRPPRHVAVIDDVVTTAATATEITRALHKAGCEQVEFWAVARTGKHD